MYSVETAEVNVYQCGADKESKDSEQHPPIRLLYVNGDHYNSIVDVERPSVGIGLGMPGLVAPEVGVEKQVTRYVVD